MGYIIIKHIFTTQSSLLNKKLIYTRHRLFEKFNKLEICTFRFLPNTCNCKQSVPICISIFNHGMIKCKISKIEVSTFTPNGEY